MQITRPVKTTFAPGYKLWPEGYKANAPRETRITKTAVYSAEWRERKKGQHDPA